MSKAINNEHKIPEGYKQTAVGIIPEEWVVSTLGSVGIWKGGGTPSKSENSFWTNGTIPWVSPKDMKTLFIEASEDYITREAVRKSSTNLVPENSILIVTRSGILRSYVPVAINLTPVTINQDLKSLTVSHGNNFKYIFYYLLCFNDRLLFEAAKDGTTVESLEFGSIKSFKIPLPPLPEQQKIAAILTTWDEAIEKTQKLIDQLKQRNKGLAQQLLTGKKRLKGFRGEWKHESLELYFKERKEFGYEKLPLLSVGESGVYLQSKSNKKDTSNEDKALYKRICVGDIGYNTMRMWQGRSALSELEGIVSPAYTIVTPRDNADAQFFSYLFKLDAVIHKFYRNSQGLVSDTWNCKFKDFKIVKVDVPASIQEQKAIAQVLNLAKHQQKFYEEKLTILKEQKKGLMQKLLTGEIRVKI